MLFEKYSGYHTMYRYIFCLLVGEMVCQLAESAEPYFAMKFGRYEIDIDLLTSICLHLNSIWRTSHYMCALSTLYIFYLTEIGN